ncbi:type II toxin-antitoxin system CcdA family antitoxin [Pseudomonas sp. RAC1]|uniref:type II toxin-antitoxin system CcdA family antitoxin n=1 Tax=Pseudomonas sp. RAC1 TaxID=3064900 RepID=UPI00272866E4|nr:type II toxin-antitoxin system CcdA family antitoxin [Pseudomonas sp. RAC1]MDV9033403.1 type II toxin-antitoxin system CcdA family antitoxin [Pseudomonas sp. RAC1]
MPADYDLTAPNESVSLSINADLLAKAAKLDVDLSAVLEQALIDAIAQCQREPGPEGRREAEPCLAVETIDPALLTAAIQLFGNELCAVEWLSRPTRALGDKRPVDAEVEQVLELIRRLEHGLGT